MPGLGIALAAPLQPKTLAAQRGPPFRLQIALKSGPLRVASALYSLDPGKRGAQILNPEPKAANGPVLPQVVYSDAHEVIHDIVRGSGAAEHLPHALYLLPLLHRLVACRAP